MKARPSSQWLQVKSSSMSNLPGPTRMRSPRSHSGKLPAGGRERRKGQQTLKKDMEGKSGLDLSAGQAITDGTKKEANKIGKGKQSSSVQLHRQSLTKKNPEQTLLSFAHNFWLCNKRNYPIFLNLSHMCFPVIHVWIRSFVLLPLFQFPF